MSILPFNLPDELEILIDSGAAGCTFQDKADKHLVEIESVTGEAVVPICGEIQPITMKGKFGIPLGGGDTLPITFKVLPGSAKCTISVAEMAKLLHCAFFMNEHHALMYDRSRLLIKAPLRSTNLYYVRPLTTEDMQTDWRQEILDSLPKAVAAADTKLISVNASGQEQSQAQEELLLLHRKHNHEAFSTIRKRCNYPAATEVDPDPPCTACNEAGMYRPNINQERSTEPQRPGSHLACDVSHLMPPDRRGRQRYSIVVDLFTDMWYPLYTSSVNLTCQ